MEAAKRAEPHIADRFSGEPLVAASIYSALAKAFTGRSAYAEARTAYDHAAAAFDKAEGPGSADATILRLREVQMEVSSSQVGSLDRAKQLISAAKSHLGGVGTRSQEAYVWMVGAQAATELLGGDVELAQRGFKTAADLAQTMPSVFDEESVFWFRQREAYCFKRLGQWDKAAALLQILLRQQETLHGLHHPDTLVVKLLQSEVLMSSGKSLPAIAKVDEILDDLTKMYGSDHNFTIVAYATRAAAEAMIENYDSAIRDDMFLYKISLAKQGPRALNTILGLNDMATAECSSGHSMEGLAHASQALVDAKVTFGNTNAMTQAVSTAVAFCLISSGRYQEASKYLDGLDSKAMGQSIADPEQAAYISLMQAAIANGLGNRVRAREFLRLPLQVYDGPNTDKYLSRWTLALNKSLSESRP